jgi:hypothetical protein
LPEKSCENVVKTRSKWHFWNSNQAEMLLEDEGSILGIDEKIGPFFNFKIIVA